MAAPDHVPLGPLTRARSYRSPDHVPDSWSSERPSDLGAEHPMGGEHGFQGPDQGFALTIAERMRDRLVLTPGEHADDVLAGAVLVGMKRSSIYGRAPVVHDLDIALRVFGFLDQAPDELVELRRRLFEGLANPHHYVEARQLVSTVPDSTLRQTPAQVAEAHRRDWRSLLSLD